MAVLLPNTLRHVSDGLSSVTGQVGGDVTPVFWLSFRRGGGCDACEVWGYLHRPSVRSLSILLLAACCLKALGRLEDNG